MVRLEIVVTVPGLPGAVPDLHESHTALKQAARNEQLSRLHALAVHLADFLRLARDIERIGCVALHAIGELERLNAGVQCRIGSTARLLVTSIEFAQETELRAAALWRSRRDF